MTTSPLPQTSRILLSETLFDEEDLRNLKRLLDDDSLVQVVSAKEIVTAASRNHLTTRQNLTCILGKDDYDNPGLWQAKDKEGNAATLLILNEDLHGHRYLYLEGVVGLAKAIMSDEKDLIAKYMGLLFDKTDKAKGVDDAELLKALLEKPREFADYVRFKPIAPFDKEELLERRKFDVENYLIAA
jgi:hypothetical protein